MNWLSYEIGKIPRTGDFPFQVQMLFFCQNWKFTKMAGQMPEDFFEINIRLNPEYEICHDIINGTEIHEPFPNAVWKLPGSRSILFGNQPRDTIAFGYHAKKLEEFKHLGIYPQACKPFVMTEKINQLVTDFKKLCHLLYSPGVIDQIDWICFQLCREIFYANTEKREVQTENERLKNLSVWFQLHLNEKINMDEIAHSNGYSRATFFRKWKKMFQQSPAQYILNLKLETAAKLLAGTNLPIDKIISEIHYSGPTAFYKRFVHEYGMTPDQYRKNQHS